MVLIYRAAVGTTGRCLFTQRRGRCAVISAGTTRVQSLTKCLREPCRAWSHGQVPRSRSLRCARGHWEEQGPAPLCRAAGRWGEPRRVPSGVMAVDVMHLPISFLCPRHPFFHGAMWVIS